VLPILSLFVIAKGMDYLELGLLMAIYSCVTAILELPTGGLADSVGKKRVYLASLCLSVMGALILLLSRNFAALALGFGILGFSRALSSGTMEAHFVDEILQVKPGADLQGIFAKVGAVVPLTLGLASLAGGALPALAARFLPARGVVNQYSLNYLAYIVMAGIQFAATCILVREEGRGTGRSPRATSGAALPRVLREAVAFASKDRSLVLVLLGGLAWGFSVSSLEQLWQPRVAELQGGGGSAIFGILGAGYFAAASLGSVAASPFCRLFRERYGLVLGAARLFMGGGLLLLAGAGGLPAFAVLYLATFAANGLGSSPEAAILNAAVPAERRSTTLSLASLFVQTGGFAGSIFLGALAKRHSIGLAWTVAALVLALSSLLYFALPRGAGLPSAAGAAKDFSTGHGGAA